MGQGGKIAVTVAAVRSRFGAQPPLVIDKDNRVIYGNVPALREQGVQRYGAHRCKTLTVGDPDAVELRVALIAEFGPDR